jgi:hypothetical protein
MRGRFPIFWKGWENDETKLPPDFDRKLLPKDFPCAQDRGGKLSDSFKVLVKMLFHYPFAASFNFLSAHR